MIIQGLINFWQHFKCLPRKNVNKPLSISTELESANPTAKKPQKINVGRGDSNRGSFRGRGSNRGRGGQRAGENDPYDITIAPLNTYENQVIPVGLHNLLKSFRPNLSTIRVSSLGTKFISRWKFEKRNNAFKF